MNLIRIYLCAAFVIGAALMYFGDTLGMFFGVLILLGSVPALIRSYSYARLIHDLKRSLGVMGVLVLLAIGMMAPRAAQAYSVTGNAPWCAFDSWLMLCYWYSQESCERNRPRLSREVVCVPNPTPRA